MKNSKRIQRILKHIDELENGYEFFCNGKHPEYAGYFREIREVINDLALERKQDHARFAKKLKGLWKVSED